MPQNKFALARYRLIDEVLRKRGCVKTNEMAEICRKKLGFKVTQRTIQLDMEALKNDPFLGCFLPVNYCTRRRVYYYENVPESLFHPIIFSQQELLLLNELREILPGKIEEKDFQVYCSFLTKILEY